MDLATLLLVLGGLGFALVVLVSLALVGRARWQRTAPSATTHPPGEAGHRAVWAEAGRSAGLVLAPDPGSATVALVGRLGGAQVRLDVRVPAGVEPDVWAPLASGERPPEAGEIAVLLQARRAAPMPRGLRVEAAGDRRSGPRYSGRGGIGTGDARLDEALTVAGDDRPATRALLGDAGVHAALRDLVEARVAFTWGPGTATATLDPTETPRFRPELALARLTQLAALVEAAATRQARPWDDLARRLGVDASARPRSGEVDGVTVSLDARFDEGAATLSVGTDLGGLALAAGAAPDGAGKPVKMPTDALERALAGRARDLYLARRILSDNALAEQLIAVLGGTRGARLEDDALLLPLTPDAAGEATLRDGVALVQRLRRVARKARR